MRRPVPFQPVHRAVRKPAPTGVGIDWTDTINRDLKGCWLFNEGSGKAAFDISGYNNKALLGTGQTWSTGLSCSGSNNEATVAASPTVDIAGKFSGSAWVYPNVSNVYQTLFSRSSSGTGADRQYTLFLSGNGTGQMYFSLGGTDIGNVVLSPNWTVGKWNHIVLTADGTNARIYINSVLANTTATVKLPVTHSAYPLSIGAEIATFPLNGLLGSQRLFNRVLSQAEISRLYTEPYAGIITPRMRFLVGVTAAGGPTLARYYYDMIQAA